MRFFSLSARMVVKKCVFLFIFTVVIVQDVFGACDTPLKKASVSFEDECGVTEIVENDIRTQIPWTVAIFFKSKSSYVYHATGAILSPTAVLTVFAGVHGKLPRKIRGKYSMHNPELTLIGAGLRTDNLTDADEYSQFAEVSYVEPYMGPERPNKEYHFVLLHMKSPLDFSTPYVRPICLQQSSNINNVYSRKSNDTIYLHGGFSKKKVKMQNVTEWETELKIQNVTTGTGYECVKNFEHFYERHFPAGMFCAKHPQESKMIESSFSCLLHGSSISEKIGDNWMLSGLTALIRGRKAGLCKHDSVYFNTKLSTSLDWIQRSLRCSPFSFSCTDGTCIPLEDVCNSVRNCMDGSDENEIFCESNNRCESKSQNHHCSLVGKCISKDELCNGKADCDEGTDESPLLCDKELRNRNLRDLIAFPGVKTYCLPIPESEGVNIDYSHHNPKVVVNCSMIPVHTVATLSCRNYYKPKLLYSNLELQCNDHGQWSSYSPFVCEPDCGMVNQKKPAIRELLVNNGEILAKQANQLIHLQYAFPWYAMIFRQDELRNFRFVCGASLVEQNFLITGANCVSERNNSLTSTRNLKIVLSPTSKNFTENFIRSATGISSPIIINVENIWRHSLYDAITMRFNIAVLKLDKKIQYNAFVRPVCYLPTSSSSQDFHFKTRISARFTGHDSGSLVGLHVSDFPHISEMLCITSSSSSDKKEDATKCVGQINGTTVHQRDFGGGLYISGKTNFGSRYILQGIMNFEDLNGAENLSFFTNLHKFRDWIFSIVNKQQYYVI